MAISKVPNTQTSGFGTASTKNTGTSPGDVVEVQTGNKLPALDGSLLTNVPGGKLLSIQTFTFPGGTYTKNPAASYVIVHVLGGGGGGGGSGQIWTLGSLCGFGGAAGGYAIKRILNSALGATETVTVGNGGTKGTSAATPTQGSQGGTSSFGSHCSATGGEGGRGLAAPSNAFIFYGATTMQGGIGVGGDINLRGASPKPASQVAYIAMAAVGADATGPYGGPASPGSPWNGAAPAPTGADAPADSGAGGNAGASTYSAATYGAPGNGGSGIVIVEEYA